MLENNVKPAFVHWNRRLNLHGEFLLLATIGCYSVPKYGRLFVLVIVFVVFSYRIASDRRFISQPLKDLRDKPDRTPSENEWLKDINKKFFSPRNVPVYVCGFAVWLATIIYSFWDLAHHA